MGLCLPGPGTSSGPRSGLSTVCTGLLCWLQPIRTVPCAQAPEGKGRSARSSGPQRPHSFSEAPRRTASMGSDGLAGDADPSKDSPIASTAYPKFPPTLNPSDLILDFCPLVLFLEQ